jgi:hypothetical protein
MKGTLSSARIRSQIYSIRGAGRPAFPLRVSRYGQCPYSFRDSPGNSTWYFQGCLRSVTSEATFPCKIPQGVCGASVDARNVLC